MDPQTARALIELAKTGTSLSTTGWVVLVIVVLAASFVGAYMAGKGRNLATRDDIADITRRVEEVKSAFASQHEEHAQANRLRLAAVERRLGAHQQAYANFAEAMNTGLTFGRDASHLHCIVGIAEYVLALLRSEALTPRPGVPLRRSESRAWCHD